MEEKNMTVKDIVDEDEARFRSVYDFVKSHRLAIVVTIVLVVVSSLGYYRYREYQRKKEMEEIVQQKIEEILNETGTGTVDIEDALGVDLSELMQHIDMDQLEELLKDGSGLTEEDIMEIMQMFGDIQEIDLSDLFTVQD